MISIVAGTNRKKALSYQIALIYQELLVSLGEESQIIDLEKLPEDFAFTALYDNAGKNEAFNTFRDQVSDSSKFVFIVPEYNGSFPGILKTFLDGMKYPNAFKNKVCGLVGLSSGMQGGALALSHLTDIFNYLGCNVIPVKPKCLRIESKLHEGKVDDEVFNKLLKEQAELLIAF